MSGSIERSWNLAKESMGVIRKDPKLMIFPIVSFIVGVVVTGILGTVAFFTDSFGGDSTVSPLGIVLVFIFYFVTYFVTIYFQVALVAAVKLRLSGGNPTLGYGIGEANKRLGAIASWAVIAAVVGLILRLLERAVGGRGGVFGSIAARIAISLVGMAWSLATFFVIPIIAYEGVGGFEAIKRSVGVIKRRWGEAVVGQVGIGLVMGLLALLVVVIFGILGILLLTSGGTTGTAFGILLISIGILGLLSLVVLSATLQSVYTAALYEYASKGQAPRIFSQSSLDSAFRPKH
jgi:membrane-anchored glycerophosphoryl diester phosphodiesterase (GDPDase)